MFYMLKILMQFNFVPQTVFSKIFFQDQDSIMKFNNKKLCFRQSRYLPNLVPFIEFIDLRNLLSILIPDTILYIGDNRQIFSGSANSLESCRVH